MGKLFGTDGIRGIAGQTLTAELAFHVGQAVAAVLTERRAAAHWLPSVRTPAFPPTCWRRLSWPVSAPSAAT